MLRAHPPADQGHFLFQDLPDLEDVNAGESLGDRDRVSSPVSPRFHFPPLPAPWMTKSVGESQALPDASHTRQHSVSACGQRGRCHQQAWPNESVRNSLIRSA